MFEKLKKAVYEANPTLVQANLVTLTWGNVSQIDREKQVIAIKPSGVAYDHLKPEDIVIVDYDGNVIEGHYHPSSDTPTHICLYKAFPTIQSIVHTHSKWATIWSQANRDIPIYGTTHADYFYGDIPCTKYIETAKIERNYEWNTGEQIVTTFLKRQISYCDMKAVLVGGHGPFTWGNSCKEAVENAIVLDAIAEMAYYRECLHQHGAVCLSKALLDRHYFRKHGKDAYYGQ